MSFWKWSRTAASNSTADSSVNWAEGQAPSSVNDSARAMMAAAAKYRDDISGSIATTGTGRDYNVASYQSFDTLAHLANNTIAFTPHTTNTGAVTLNVDGLGAKPVRPSPGVELPTNSLLTGTPYLVLYSNFDGVFYIQGGFVTALNVPLGAGMDFWGTVAPNSAFAIPYGQAISRSTYATLFSLFGTTYGAGDGSTTFNLPDKRGRVSAGTDTLNFGSASRISTNSVNSAALGGVGGGELVTLTTGNLPIHNHTGTVPLSVNVSVTGTAATALTTHNHSTTVAFSGTTSVENAAHQHNGSGTTANMNRNNPHNHSYTRVNGFAAQSGTATNCYTTTISDVTGSTDIAHEHNFSFTSDTETAQHGHTYSMSNAFTSADANLAHTHTVTGTGTGTGTGTFTTDNTGSAVGVLNLQPTILCNYIIRII